MLKIGFRRVGRTDHYRAYWYCSRSPESGFFAGIKDATLKKAFIVALIGSFVALLLDWIPLAGLLIVFVAVMVLVRLVYFTTWPKAFVPLWSL